MTTTIAPTTPKVSARPFDYSKYPNCARGDQYARDVVSGKIVASRYVIGACQRYLREVVAQDQLWIFKPAKAEKFLKTVQRFSHVNGTWATENIKFEPWQCWVWMNIMGFIFRETGFRRFRIAHVEVARGNGKSAMASQAALYFMALDNPNGNQVSTVATKKEQARIVLDAARAMARRNQGFRRAAGVKVLAHSIIQDKTNSLIRALSSEHSGLDGLADVLAICDELHAMKRDTFEVIYSGMSKRKDSLTLCITTSGSDITSVGYTQSNYAKRICLGLEMDDQFFAAVYCLDEAIPSEGVEEDDWTDPAVWLKANPNLGISVDEVTLAAKVQKAISTPADVANIKIKHMNMWISEALAYYSLPAWDRCADPDLKIEDFKNVPGRGGLDLAISRDLTAVASVFYKQGTYYLFCDSFLPQGKFDEDSKKNDVYVQAFKSGDLIVTPGESMDFDFIKEHLLKLAAHYSIKEIAYDPWNATEMSQKLSQKIEMVKLAQNVGNFSEPMKKLDGLMREGKIRHNGSPLLRWCLGNVVAKMDTNDNVKPNKADERLKIDPIIAILMALALWLQEENKDSIYSTRGLRIL